jgi:hypothetical protein
LRTTGLGKRSDVTPVRRWVATAVVVPLLVAGCSDDPEPRFEQSPAPSPTESTSEATAPEAWEVKSEKGAVAFAKHWIDVFNEAQRTGGTAPLQAISGPGCGSCDGFVEMLDDLYANGGHLESQGWRVLQSVPAPGMPARRPEVTMRIVRTPQRIYESDGSKPESFSGGRATYSARLEWNARGWQMADLVLMT